MATWQVIAGTPTLDDNGRGAAFNSASSYLAVSLDYFPNAAFVVIDTSDWSIIPGTPDPSNSGIGYGAAFSPDDAYIALVHGNSPYLTVANTSDWSVVAGTPVLPSAARGAAFSPDGAYLAVAHSNSPYITIIDTSDWSVVAGTPTLAGTGHSCAFNHDGSYLIVGHFSGNSLTVIDTSDWSVVAGTPSLPGTCLGCTFNDTGTYLAAAHGGSPFLTVVDTSDWSVVAGTPTLAGIGNSCKFNANGVLAVGHDTSPFLTLIDSSDWSVVAGTPTLPGSGEGVSFSPDGRRLAVAHTSTPYLSVLENTEYSGDVAAVLSDTTALFVQAGGDIAGALQPTTVSMSGSAVVAGDITVTLADTVTGFDGDVVYEGAISISLDDAQAYFVEKFTGDIAFTLDDTQAEFLVGTPEDVMLAGTVQTLVDTSLAALVSEVATSTLIKQTFYQTSEEPLLTAAGTDSYEIAFVVEELLAATAQLDLQERISVYEWLRGLSVLETETFVRYMIDELIRAEAVDSAITAHAMSEVLASIASDSVLALQAANVIEEMTAALVAVNTLHLIVEETLEAEVTDSQESLAHYMQNVNELAGARLLFKLSDEVVQAWVMNVEGERPMSQYENFDFTSYCEIDGVWFATDDEGVYRLGGDTDDGADIGARLRSLIMDFGTSRLKRVVSAYMGYTASGKLVFRLRSVDQGQLVEHWYEAKQLTAEAPRQGRIAVGRGLRSRYWQFEIVNVDGADFELDKVELHPLLLDRRV